MTTKELAIRISTYILSHPGVSYDELEEKAHGVGVTSDAFEQAIEAVHKMKTVEAKSRADGTLVYTKAGPARVDPFTTRFEWLKDNYPKMTAENNGQHEIWDGVDMSYLFMKPDEAEEWWKKRKPWLHYAKR